MISSLVLCEALSDGHVPVSNGYLLFSALARRLSEFGGPEPLHGAPGFKGVALSALTPESFWRTLHYSWGKGVLQLQKGDRLAFRVSFLDDALGALCGGRDGLFPHPGRGACRRQKGLASRGKRDEPPDGRRGAQGALSLRRG